MGPLHEYLKDKHGRVKDLAEALGITGPAISQWTRVPAERLFEVERLTGIPAWKLRPDLVRKPKK